jgi:hypothetical protein
MAQATQNLLLAIVSPSNWAAAGNKRWLALLNLALAAAAISFAVGYLWLNNQTAAYGFEIRGYEKQISELQDAKRRLDLEVLTRRSMINIESRVESLGFVPVEQVDYLVAGPSGVALR